ncbi:MAG: hypothetical protein HYY11_03045 [Candidatus Methylomirabilis oxyfera]|nr:hypothetical protein [Candidatus Methylomirabilis oxyfera]
MGDKSKEQRMLDTIRKDTTLAALGGLSPRAFSTLCELRVHAGYAEIAKLNVVKKLQELKADCLEHGVSWEQFADEHLPLGRRMIDNYLNTLKAVGEYAYEEVVAITSVAEQRMASRLLKNGTIRHEDGAIIISGKRIVNDAAHAYQIVEVLREAFTQAEAAKDDAKKKDEQLTRHQETARKEHGRLHEMIDRKEKEIEWLKNFPTPPGITDEERPAWRRVFETMVEIDVWLEKLVGAAGRMESREARDAVALTLLALASKLRHMQEELIARHPDAFDGLLDTNGFVGGPEYEASRADTRTQMQAARTAYADWLLRDVTRHAGGSVDNTDAPPAA